MNTGHQTGTVLVSGGAGYIGSHVVHALKAAGFMPVIIDNLSKGNLWAAMHAEAFCRGDVGDVDFVRSVCNEFHPLAAVHFAAFIEAAESVEKPELYFANNRDKAKQFFAVLAERGVRNVVLSSTATVYGEAPSGPIPESVEPRPIHPYGQSMLAAEETLRALPSVNSVTLRYFNVAGALASVGLGEAHFPETHLIPRLILPLTGLPGDFLAALGLDGRFRMYGTDYPTRDGTAIRDYLHVCDLAEAHILALRHLLSGGASDVFNLGGRGTSVLDIVAAARTVLKRPDFAPELAPKRPGDPAVLVTDSGKARGVLGWKPRFGVEDMIASAAQWHRTALYRESMAAKIRDCHRAELLRTAKEFAAA